MKTISTRLFALGLALTACCVPITTAAAQPAKKSSQAPTSPTPQPFDLVLGKATLASAQETWLREGAKAIGEGFGDAKPSYVDNDPDGVANERVLIVDVKGLPVERLQSARFGFFDNTLYLVKYQFEAGADFDNIFKQVSSKYGTPHRRGGFGDEVVEWRFGQVILTMEKKFIGNHTMLFLHEPLLRKVKTSHSEVYAHHIQTKAHAQKGF